MAPMNQSTHTLMAFSSHTVGWVIHRKSVISFCTSQDFPLHRVNSLSVFKPSLLSLSRSLAAQSSGARRDHKEVEQ